MADYRLHDREGNSGIGGKGDECVAKGVEGRLRGAGSPPFYLHACLDMSRLEDKFKSSTYMPFAVLVEVSKFRQDKIAALGRISFKADISIGWIGIVIGWPCACLRVFVGCAVRHVARRGGVFADEALRRVSPRRRRERRRRERERGRDPEHRAELPRVPSAACFAAASGAEPAKMRRVAQDCDPKAYMYTPSGRKDAQIGHLSRASTVAAKQAARWRASQHGRGFGIIGA